jgi:hypothetical protein
LTVESIEQVAAVTTAYLFALDGDVDDVSLPVD